MKPIYILNGPNLNLLGQRLPELYGSETLADIEHKTSQAAKSLGFKTVFRQSNEEGALVSFIAQANADGSGLILNAAAYTHTSVALRDAVEACSIPVVEVHISNIFRREPFRSRSYLSGVVDGLICGFGTQGYALALSALHHILTKSS